MKISFYVILLTITLCGHVSAETSAVVPANDSGAFNVQIDLDDNDTGNDNISEQELERKIKNKVLSLIVDVLDKASEGLTEDEKSEIKEAIEDIKIIKNDAEDSHSINLGSDKPSIPEAILGAMAIFLLFGTPVMIVAAIVYASYRKKRLMHETINQYVSSGKDIPPEVLNGLQKEAAPKSNLHKGLVMSGIGLGIFACFAVIGKLDVAAIGLIPLFIGLAQLLIWKLETR